MSLASPVLVLASASPRRAELLRSAGIDFTIRVADVDETPLPDECAEAHVTRLAAAKAHAIAGRGESAAILGADTVVVVDGRILGKPTDLEDARAMLRSLSGRTHEVLTGVCLIGPTGQPTPTGAGGSRPSLADLSRTVVEFAPLEPAEIEWYVNSGEPMDKAGAYAIQGLASRFVTRIDGSYSNVVGLPLTLVYGLCRRLGILVS